MIKSLSDIKDFLSLKIVENKKKNDLSKKKKKKIRRQVVKSLALNQWETMKGVHRGHHRRESAQRLRNTFLEQINGATLSLFSLTSPRVSKRSKLEENLAHRRDGKNYNNPKNYNLLSKWRRSLVSE